MNASLTTKANVWLLSVCLAFLVPFLVTASPVPWPFVSLAFGLGALGGFAQLLAMRQASAAFVRAETLMDVRRVLSGTLPGKIYLGLFWVSQLALLAISVATLGRPFWVCMLAGYCSYAVGRELVTLKGCAELERLAAGGRT